MSLKYIVLRFLPSNNERLSRLGPSTKIQGHLQLGNVQEVDCGLRPEVPQPWTADAPAGLN